MKPIHYLLPALLAWWAPLSGATYYLSGNPAASDSNAGTSPLASWKTITKLNSANLLAGDSVLFERGWTYRGQINAKPGAPGAPVYYGAWGEGPKPVISGALPLANTGWTVYSGNIYVKSGVTMPSMAAAEPPNLFVGGRLMLPARYPDEGFLQAGVVYGGNPGSHCCEFSVALEDDELSPVFPNDSDLKGAHLTGYDPYGVSSRLVTDYDPAIGRVAFDTLRGLGFINRRWYFFTRKLNFLDSPGEWYYDAAAKKLYLWKYDSSAPAPADEIEYSSAAFGISDWQTPYITVEGLEFRYQQIAGLWVIRSTGVTVKGNRFFNSKYGIHGWGSSTVALEGTVVEDNDFDDIHRVAINLNNYIKGASVTGNRLHNVGRVNALMQSGQPDQWSNYGYWEYGKGIELKGSNTLIARNRVDSTGRQAIAAGGPGVVIRNNVIDCPCLNYNDCGGIMPLGSSRVEGNVIRNSYGYFRGESEYGGQGARSIYPDFCTHDTIRNNTIVHTRIGIGLTNSKFEMVEHNTAYDCELAGFRMNRKDAGQLSNRVVGNIFFGTTHSQTSLMWDNQVDGPDDNSQLDSNRYWNPYNYFPIFKYRSDIGLPETWYDLEQWQALGFDQHSEKEYLFKNQPWRIADTLGQSLAENGSFDVGLDGWANTGNMVVSINPGQLDGACASITYNGVWAGSFYQDIAQPFLPGQAYLIGFSLAGSINAHGEPLELRIVETADVDAAHFYRVFKNQTQRREYWSVFVADTDAPLSIRFSAPNGTYFLDNIAVLPLSADWLDPHVYFPVFVNDAEEAMEITLPPCQYLDLDGQPVGESITLEPFSSRILVLDTCVTTAVKEVLIPLLPELHIFPNPTEGPVQIRFFVPGPGPVSLRIYDMQGRLHRILVDTDLGAGEYGLALSGQELGTGMFVVVFEMNGKKVWKNFYKE